MKEIQDRFDKGYTMSLYGTREMLYEQMLDDISSLLNLFSARKKQIEERVNYLNLVEKDLWEKNLPNTAEVYRERKQELEKLQELWKHFTLTEILLS